VRRERAWRGDRAAEYSLAIPREVFVAMDDTAREAIKAEREGRGASWWKGLTGNTNSNDSSGKTPTERDPLGVVNASSSSSPESTLTSARSRSVGVFPLESLEYRSSRYREISASFPLLQPVADNAQVTTALPSFPSFALPKRLASHAGTHGERFFGTFAPAFSMFPTRCAEETLAMRACVRRQTFW
jgi:hypothetical protein